MQHTGLIERLNFLCKTYDGLNKLIVSTKNRVQAINKEAMGEHQDEVIAMESLKGKIQRKIAKELENWPIWELWLKKVPGIGPFIAGNLILLFFYRFSTICPECGGDIEKKDGGLHCLACGKTLKGEGILNFKIEQKDFPTVSKWWAYMGRKVVDGKVVRRKKGEQSNWSTKGKMIGYQIGEQFNRQNRDHPYKQFLNERKELKRQKHPDEKKGHIHNMALNETIKLFLSHFWHVAREIDGKSTEGPYAEVVMQHTGIIAPYYWEPNAQ